MLNLPILFHPPPPHQLYRLNFVSFDLHCDRVTVTETEMHKKGSDYFLITLPKRPGEQVALPDYVVTAFRQLTKWRPPVIKWRPPVIKWRQPGERETHPRERETQRGTNGLP